MKKLIIILITTSALLLSTGDLRAQQEIPFVDAHECRTDDCCQKQALEHEVVAKIVTLIFENGEEVTFIDVHVTREDLKRALEGETIKLHITHPKF